MTSQVHRLFFALRPNAALRAELERSIADLKATRRIHGRWIKAEKLHLTLQFLGDFIAADDIVRRARNAGGSLRACHIELVLDRAETFARRFNPPCVLRCTATSDTRLREFSRELGNALTDAGLGEHLERRPFVPHLTIAYVERALPEPIAIPPIVWRAEEFALMDSLVGRSTHAELVRWPLSG